MKIFSEKLISRLFNCYMVVQFAGLICLGAWGTLHRHDGGGHHRCYYHIWAASDGQCVGSGDNEENHGQCLLCRWKQLTQKEFQTEISVDPFFLEQQDNHDRYGCCVVSVIQFCSPRAPPLKMPG